MPAPVVRRILPLCPLTLLALACAQTAMASNGGLTPVSPASPNAQGITDTYWLILAFTGAIFLLVTGLVLAFVVRFRNNGRSRTEEGPQIHGSTKLELIWTVLPVGILAVIAGFVFYELPGIKDVPSASAGSGRLEVQVIAHQFYWEFRYPNGAGSIDELVVPTDEPVHLTVTAPDVAHSWWIPALGGKIDAIPGQVNHSWFKAERAGTYEGQCAELCGIIHAKMTADVRAVEQGEYDSWVAQQKSQSPEQLGKAEFNGVCSKCHGLAAQGGVGPPIATNPLTTDFDGLQRLVREGRNLMSPVAKGWSDDQIRALVAYFETKPFSGGTSGS